VNPEGIGCGLGHMALDRVQWRSLLNTVMNLRATQKAPR
jgi:hypothetical protein